MAKVNMKRGRESGTPSAAPETTVHIIEPRTANPVKRDQSTPLQAGTESASSPEVIDADYNDTSTDSADFRHRNASGSPRSDAEAGSTPLRTVRQRPLEFSFVNYVLLFFGAALLSALVMLAVLGQL
jgi:hypothetical protein